MRLHFDRSVKQAFCGCSINSEGGLLVHRELDDALGLTDMAANLVADQRIGKNGRHHLAGLLRQSIFSRLAGYEDVNDAERLRVDPVMRQLVGGRAVKHGAASASAMGRFEVEMLTRPENLDAVADLSGRWIDAVHDRQPPKSITLDMDSSESSVHGDQEGAAPALSWLIGTLDWGHSQCGQTKWEIPASCLPWLQSLKNWSLRQTRGGLGFGECTTFVAD